MHESRPPRGAQHATPHTHRCTAAHKRSPPRSRAAPPLRRSPAVTAPVQASRSPSAPSPARSPRRDRLTTPRLEAYGSSRHRLGDPAGGGCWLIASAPRSSGVPRGPAGLRRPLLKRWPGRWALPWTRLAHADLHPPALSSGRHDQRSTDRISDVIAARVREPLSAPRSSAPVHDNRGATVILGGVAPADRQLVSKLVGDDQAKLCAGPDHQPLLRVQASPRIGYVRPPGLQRTPPPRARRQRDDS